MIFSTGMGGIEEQIEPDCSIGYRHFPDETVVERVAMLFEHERELLLEELEALGELRRRRLHQERGASSLFVYLTRELGVPRASAQRRCVAVEILEEFPAAWDWLRNGLSLVKLCALRRVLRKENCDELLAFAFSATENAVRRRVAALDPRAARPDRVEPIDDQRSEARLTVEHEVVDLIEEAKMLLSHETPDATRGAILLRAMRDLVAMLKKAKLRADKGAAQLAEASSTACDERHEVPRWNSPNSPKSMEPKASRRRIPRAVAKAVWRRDEGRCAFVGVNHRRCGSRYQLELHHVVPHGLGGRETVDNLRVYCRVHNQLEARRELGDAIIDEKIRER